MARRSGMTLLELIAALAILGGLVVFLSLTFRSAVLNRQKIADNLGTIDQARGVMNIIVHDLEQMHVYDSRAYLLVEQRQVNGKDVTSIAFPCLTPVRVSEDLREKPGLIEVAYLVGEDPRTPGALRVFRRELPIETVATTKEIRTSDQGLVLLADGLTRFQMQFLAPPTTDETAEAATTASSAEKPEPEFLEKWEGGFAEAATLPIAIRLQIQAGASGDSGPQMALERTVRLPLSKVEDEMVQSQLQLSLIPPRGSGQEATAAP